MKIGIIKGMIQNSEKNEKIVIKMIREQIENEEKRLSPLSKPN